MSTCLQFLAIIVWTLPLKSARITPPFESFLARLAWNWVFRWQIASDLAHWLSSNRYQNEVKILNFQNKVKFIYVLIAQQFYLGVLQNVLFGASHLFQGVWKNMYTHVTGCQSRISSMFMSLWFVSKNLTFYLVNYPKL